MCTSLVAHWVAHLPLCLFWTSDRSSS
uniref:Uncharacterized protein n=1 Tax=Anguilla anguilla TaxID=7936 RepID=A0A0E9T375_ANGAN